MGADKSGAKSSSIGQLPQFFRESKEELKKITTPNRQETIQATLATVMIIIFFSVCLLVLDVVCHWLMELLT